MLPPPTDLVGRFTERLERVKGVVHRATANDVADVVRKILEGVAARRVAWTDAPDVQPARGALAAEFIAVDVGDRDALLEADAGVTSAQWAVAETGSLILDASAERHRLASLLPGIHVAIVPVSRMLATMGEALAKAHAAGPSPCMTIVTGPSRTADIELTLVVGVHGPRELHVVLVG